jgi:hypothetical protein
MSWNINIVGFPRNVKASVLAEKYVPQPIKDAVMLFCDSYDNKPNVLLQVKTYGHFDAVYGGSIGNLSIEKVDLVIAPPPA